MKNFMLFALIAAILSTSAGAAITAVIDASRTSDCVAPCAIFFSSRGTGCTTVECDNDSFDNEAFHTLHYEWSFGDPDAGTWAVSGQSKNIEYGPLAIHVYDEPGQYTVQLTVNSATESATDSVTVNVDDPETVFSGTTRCISTNADFTGCPVACPSANCVSSSDYDASLLSALTAGARRILFHAGQTFILDSTPGVNTDGPVILGSFGSANDGKAIIDGTGCGTCDVISAGWPHSGQIDDWRIMDLEILQAATGSNVGSAVFNSDGWYTPGASPTFDNILVYHLERMSGNRFWGQMRASPYFPQAAIGVFLVENEVAGETGNTIYLATRGGGIVGNTVGKPSGDYPAHMLRFGSPGRWEEALIAHNEWKCCGAIDITHRGEDGRAGDQEFEVDPVQFLVIRKNIYRSGSTGMGSALYDPGYRAIGIHPQNTGSPERLRDIIVEENIFEDQEVRIAARSVTVRNNLFSGSSPPYPNIRPGWSHACAIPSDWVTDIFIYHNSHADFSGYYPVQYFSSCGAIPIANIVVRNNINYGGSDNPYIDAGSFPAGTTLTESNNLGNNALSSSPYAVDSPSISSLSDWYLTGDSAGSAINAGFNLGSTVYDDFEHNLRDSSPDLGAFEYTGGSPPTTDTSTTSTSTTTGITSSTTTTSTTTSTSTTGTTSSTTTTATSSSTTTSGTGTTTSTSTSTTTAPPTTSGDGGDGGSGGDGGGSSPGGGSISVKDETCFDGIRNQGEDDVDCGGPCVPCPTCRDGIMNQGEEGVDCGGPCPACAEGVVTTISTSTSTTSTTATTTTPKTKEASTTTQAETTTTQPAEEGRDYTPWLVAVNLLLLAAALLVYQHRKKKKVEE